MPAPKGNKNAVGNKGGGRPSSYKKEYAKAAQKLYELGATDYEVGQSFGVSNATILNWQQQHVEFSEASRVGKAAADDRVERAFYHKAVGYTFESEKVFQFQGEIVRAKTLEHVPPDTQAAQFWLKNRRKEVWRDKTDHEVVGKDGEALIPDSSPRDIARAVLDVLREAQIAQSDSSDG
jgi:hypothetical protein